MSADNSLTPEQIATIQTWADAGADLSEIQKKLGDEMEVRVTYMEMRFLIEDIGVELKSDPEPEPEEAAEPEAETPEENEAEAGPQDFSDIDEDAVADPNAAAATAKVSISELERPGMMASGRVEFDCGESAEWYVDQMGQLGMNPDNKEFKPSEAQIRAFQSELQEAAKKKGM